MIPELPADPASLLSVNKQELEVRRKPDSRSSDQLAVTRATKVVTVSNSFRLVLGCPDSKWLNPPPDTAGYVREHTR